MEIQSALSGNGTPLDLAPWVAERADGSAATCDTTHPIPGSRVFGRELDDLLGSEGLTGRISEWGVVGISHKTWQQGGEKVCQNPTASAVSSPSWWPS